MEKFNLEKYLANPSRKVVTRNGRNVRIVCTDRNINNFPIVALIQLYNNSDEKVIKKFIKYKASLLAAICVLMLLIQCGAVIVIVNNFIHCIFMN